MVQNVQFRGFIPKIAWVDNHIVGFSEEDAQRLYHPHDDALVVSIRMEDYNTHQFLVDNGSFANKNRERAARVDQCINQCELVPS